MCSESLANGFEFIVPADPEADEGEPRYEEEILTDPFETLTRSLSGSMCGLS